MGKPRKQTTPTPLTEARERIRQAERKLAQLGRETVGVDTEGYENIATLIERGFGKKADVLRQALQSGLRVLVASSTPSDDGYSTNGAVLDYGGNASTADDAQSTLDAIRGSHVPAGPPITTPPSTERKLEAGEDVELEDPQAP